jgi:uncharacterized lipoprotein YajG
MKPRTGLLLSIIILVAVIFLSACSQQKEIAVGNNAPDFSLPSATGSTVSLSDFRDQRPVLLYFHMAMG